MFYPRIAFEALTPEGLVCHYNGEWSVYGTGQTACVLSIVAVFSHKLFITLTQLSYWLPYSLKHENSVIESIPVFWILNILYIFCYETIYLQFYIYHLCVELFWRDKENKFAFSGISQHWNSAGNSNPVT